FGGLLPDVARRYARRRVGREAAVLTIGQVGPASLEGVAFPRSASAGGASRASMVRASRGRGGRVPSGPRRGTGPLRRVLPRGTRAPVQSPVLRDRGSARRGGADAGRVPEALGTMGRHRS